jgi:signal transduction histidine kinase
MADQAHPVPEGVTGRRLHPTTRQPLGRMGRRLLVTILLVSLTTLGVLSIGTVVPHLLARRGHAEAVEVEWLLAATALAVLFALVTSYIASVRLTAPLEDFLRMTRRFAAGDHGARVPDSGREEIADLTHALNAAAEEVQRSELARQRFTDEIAHELRTPLAALQAGLEELRDGLAPADPAALAALHDQATRLGRIVEDLGQLSAAETLGLQLSLDEVDLGEVAALALASREGSMTAAGLLVERDLDGGVVVSSRTRCTAAPGTRCRSGCASYEAGVCSRSRTPDRASHPGSWPTRSTGGGGDRLRRARRAPAWAWPSSGASSWRREERCGWPTVRRAGCWSG